MMTKRIELLDLARGVALVAMTIFHFGFDLQMFGLKEPGYIDQAHWKYFARVIASSFLFLAGFSLYLSHGEGIRWKSWRWRMVKIVGAAVIITVATYFATPDAFIFFGILHAIAFASLFGLIFIQTPWWLVSAIAVGFLIIHNIGRTDVLDAWYWWWTGLSQTYPISSDYVPVFPWMAAPLFGIAFAKLSRERNWLDAFAKPQLNHLPGRVLKFMGRNSLVYYLLHQPIMIGVMIAYFWSRGWLTF